jgi:hypothetical protein
MADTLRLALEIEPSDPISGTLRDAGGLTRPFSGWLGLISALEGLRVESSVEADLRAHELSGRHPEGTTDRR